MLKNWPRLAGVSTARMQASADDLDKVHGKLLTVLGRWIEIRALVRDASKRVDASAAVAPARALRLIRGGKP